MRTWVLLAVVFAAGAAIGYVARSPDGGPAEAARSSAPAPAPPRQPTRGRFPNCRGRPPASLSAAIGALPSPDLERSPEAIRGTLRTGEGDPVGGVKIVAQTWSEEESRTKDDELRGGGARLREAPGLREGGARRGDHRLRRLLHPHRSRGRPLPALGRERRLDGHREAGPQREIRPGVEVNSSATPVVTLDVSVRLPDDTEPKTAMICWSGGSVPRERPIRNPWRPGARKVRLAPGKYTLWATGGELLELASAKQELTLAAGERRPPLVLRLGDQPGILGTVTMRGGGAASS